MTTSGFRLRVTPPALRGPLPLRPLVSKWEAGALLYYIAGRELCGIERSTETVPRADMIKRLAVLDDYQGAAFAQPYWKRIENRVELEGYRDTLHDEDRLVERLRAYQILVPIRERTHFSARVLQKLPALELLSLTGKNSGQVDLGCRHGAGDSGDADGGFRRNGYRDDHGADAGAWRIAWRKRTAPCARDCGRRGWDSIWRAKRLGVIGLGRIGSRIAAFGNHLGMRVLAWSAESDAEEKPRLRARPIRRSMICSGRATSSRCTCGFRSARGEL